MWEGPAELEGGKREVRPLTCLLVAHSDGHGIVSAAVTRKNLEREGKCQKIDFYCKPGKMDPEEFWESTVDELDVDKYDAIFILDIALDKKNYQQSVNKLLALCQKKEVHYIDHHEMLPGTKQQLEKYCRVKHVGRSEDVVYGEPDRFWSRVGAITDRDPSVLPISERELVLSKGLDVFVREGRYEEAYKKMLENDTGAFVEAEKRYPTERLPVERYENLVVFRYREGWGNRMLESAMRRERVPYGVSRMRKRGRTRFVVLKDWLALEWPEPKPLLEKVFPPSSVFGHPGVVNVEVPDEEADEAERKIVDVLSKAKKV